MGDVESITVTVEVQVFEFALGSVMVKVTVLVPVLEQVKVEGDTLVELTEQLSVDPASTSPALIEEFPEPSR